MEINLNEQGDVTVLAITGSVDSMSSETLSQALCNQVEAGKTRLVLDFQAVRYTSSAGLRSLLIGLKTARKAGGDLRIGAMQPSVEEVLHLAGFTSIIKVFADVNAAVSSYAQAL
jgi:anti-sigma B factor antagonist